MIPPARPTRGRSSPMFMPIMFLVALLTTAVILIEINADVLLTAMILATLPVPLYIALVLWLDRFESEPARLLIQAFAWGATGAVLISYLLNTLAGAFVAGLAGEDVGMLFGIVVSAPVVEEIAKGGALFLLYIRSKDEFDGITDGIIYAAMVGLGFAMVENVIYYGRAMAEGGEAVAQTFLLRGILSPFAHPLFTAMTGIGLGWARVSRRPAVRSIVPLAGLGAAMLLHFLWNASAAGDMFFGAYILIMVPMFLGVAIVIVFSLRRESEIIRQHLQLDLDRGILTLEEYRSLYSANRRMARSWRALRGEGVPAWRACREFHQVASELAFHRWRSDRDLGLAEGDREEYYVQRLVELKEKLAGAV